MNKKQLGEKILNLRKTKCLTQEQLAEIIGVAPSTIRRWEHGERMPEEVNLDRIATYFGVNAVELLSEYTIPNNNESEMNNNGRYDNCQPPNQSGKIDKNKQTNITKDTNTETQSKIQKGRGLFIRYIVCVCLVFCWGVITSETSICNNIKQDRILYYPVLVLFLLALCLIFGLNLLSFEDRKCRKITVAGSIVFVFLGVVWMIIY